MGESPDRVERIGEAGEDRTAKPEPWFSRASGPSRPAEPAESAGPAEERPAAGAAAERSADPRTERGAEDPRPGGPAAAGGAEAATPRTTERAAPRTEERPADARSEGRSADAPAEGRSADAPAEERPAGSRSEERTEGLGDAPADRREPAGSAVEAADGDAVSDADPDADAEAQAVSVGVTPARPAGDSEGRPAGPAADEPVGGPGPRIDSPTTALRLPEPDRPEPAPDGADELTTAMRLPESDRPAPAEAVPDQHTTALRVPKLDEPTRALRQVSIPQGPREHTEVPPYDAPEQQAYGWQQAPPQPPKSQSQPPQAEESSSGLGQFGWGRSPQPPAPGGAAPLSPSPESTSEAMDVLASLSRKPSSPLRRAIKRISIWGVLLCFLLVILAIVQVLRPLPSPSLKMTADSAYAFGGSAPTLDWPASGQATAEVSGLGTLGHSGSDNPVAIASVTKVMTAHLILKDHPLKKGDQGPTITVDQQAVNDYNTGVTDQESVVKVTVGEQISEYQALEMLLIPSANNIARLLGRWDAGTDAAFVTKMQAEATALSMTKSTYTDPSGLEGTTKSTANDQLKLAEVVMQDAVFREIVSTPSFTPPGGTLTYNNNSLLGGNGVIGVKTGTSSSALGCLMWAAQTKVGGTTRTIVGVVLSQPATGGDGGGWLPNVLKNSKKVVISAEGALKAHTVAKKGDVVGYVDDGLGGKTPVVVSKDVTVAGWGGLSVDISLEPVGGGLPHQAAAGTTVGNLVVGTGASAQTVPVQLQSQLKQPTAGAKLTRLG
ncbi:D-alanyl-D-alanine carboxypeptidase [Streptacidiphilus carbonis]|uniref:D-alanyl-D-alanine carboxypeptidase n=1 Tax=Streptacidiphilus carbonis TaxID=105422 RepID=UPI000A50F5BD|nr:D-alanyl-D-alanine carboxypeptidase [Streptacidiphilus carbonis]